MGSWWLGLVWLGLAWFGSARLGWVQHHLRTILRPVFDHPSNLFEFVWDVFGIYKQDWIRSVDNIWERVFGFQKKLENTANNVKNRFL